MSDYKQCVDGAQTGPGVAVSGSITGLQSPKSPALTGGIAPTGVPTGKQGQ